LVVIGADYTFIFESSPLSSFSAPSRYQPAIVSPLLQFTDRAVIASAISLMPQTEGGEMAKYGKAASESVRKALREEKRGKLRSGKGGKGGVVTSRKQAIAIGLSEARKKGAKVPKKKSS
jgi:hypothetical protein